MLVGKSPWLASQWLFRSPGNLVSSTAATSTWFHARWDKHSSAGPACLADTRYAYLSRWVIGTKWPPPLPPGSSTTFLSRLPSRQNGPSIAAGLTRHLLSAIQWTTPCLWSVSEGGACSLDTSGGLQWTRGHATGYCRGPACSLISVYDWESAIEAISAGRLLNCFKKFSRSPQFGPDLDHAYKLHCFIFVRGLII